MMAFEIKCNGKIHLFANKELGNGKSSEKFQELNKIIKCISINDLFLSNFSNIF